MQIRTMALVAAGFVAAVGSAGVYAANGTISLRPDTANFSFGGGGEFGVTAFSGASVPGLGAGVGVQGYLFQTFCLERNENLDALTQKTWTLSDSAHAGGVSGAVNGTDPICAETAYLYTRFWSGTLAGYDYDVGSDRCDSAGQLQAAIWYLEGEYTSSQLALFPQGEDWVLEAQQAVASHAWSGLGDVRVLTLLDASTGAVQQDVLVRTGSVTVTSTGSTNGRTPGFWGNKNGQALIGSDDLAMLVAANLVDAKGNEFNPSSKVAFKTWLRNGTAVNMAYMLSVQMSAMKLNVLNGFVDETAQVHVDTSVDASGTISISDLIAKADAELGLHPYTPSGSPYRSYQESLKNGLDAANNNTNWVNP